MNKISRKTKTKIRIKNKKIKLKNEAKLYQQPENKK